MPVKRRLLYILRSGEVTRLENLASCSFISGSSIRKFRRCSFCAAVNSTARSLSRSLTLFRRLKYHSSSDQSVSSSISSSGPYGEDVEVSRIKGAIWRG